ncbi:hypothetical protein [Vibrio parahaemolyticus]|uniref:hypothetical protein n=2 Tax=Vibrio parahaemolyticus TaxID=670 RepID=UPI0011243124|nr:hypothetical protein [Vibrio parahaemolyticus]EIV1707542.1 hypothetical protein [Vibrio parahaemolyticus]ELI5433859.1 hypothetical protein [Vibrio parahaemolyticus]MDF4674368.1 hypothetical protein [Vibrio parahaemolyticus]MDF4698619.1 hypothetical protein [Vibrio parahaemolyticus]TOI59301.1 hypothetical protein CGI56_23740 [Vibrio parahaemolyticus]
MKYLIYRNLDGDYVYVEGNLTLKYEINLTGMTYDYSGRLNATELFELWLEAARKKYSDGIVEVEWKLTMKEGTEPELIPAEEFVNGMYFHMDATHPLSQITGLILDWTTMPIEPQVWDADTLEGLGFIEYVTGWQPNILQTQVRIDFLIEAAKKKVEVE